MLDAVRAEALKLRRHRATWLMVWIYPIAFTLIIGGVLLYGMFAAHGPAGPPQPAAEWIQDSTMLWKVPTSAPGRFLIAGFAAVVFAGEYGWNTWKLIIPARTRWQLIAAKWAVTLGFLVIALVAADLITLLGGWLGSLQDGELPAGLTLAAVAEAHWKAGAHALLPIIYTIAFAALFAILTQSILATVILSIAMVVVEGMLPLIAIFFHGYAPALTAWMVKVLPLYHMANLNAWAKGGATIPLGPKEMLSLPWTTSFWALTAWIVAAGVGTQVRFLRQDLN